MLYHSLLDKYGSRLEKEPSAQDYRNMVDDILGELTERGNGRFLKLKGIKEGFCVVMGEDERKNKINMALRNRFHETKRGRAEIAKEDNDDDDDDDDDSSNNTRCYKRTKGESNTVVAPSIVASRMPAKNEEKPSGKAKVGDNDDDFSHGTNYNKNNIHRLNTPAILSPPPSNDLWNFEELYRSTSQSPSDGGLYGSQEDEIRMRRWLNDHKLPQSVGDVFVRHGARNVEDALLLVQHHSNLLNKLAFLDLWKLERAVQPNRNSHRRH